MKFKKAYVYIFIALMVVIISIGLIKVNIINTKALSPIGNSEDNYNMITLEFGEDFDKFIQDNANVKIYNEEEGTTVNINDISLKLKDQSPIISKIKEIINNITESCYNLFDTITDKIADMIS